MKNATNKIRETRNVDVKTFDWEGFANNIPNGIIAAHELIQNGIAAGGENPEVHVIIKKEKEHTYLYVKNVGRFANIQEVLNYGHSSHETAMNQYGTGFKSAMSYFNPSDYEWEFFTHEGDYVEHVKGPFGSCMQIECLDTWPFEKRFASVARVRVESPEIRLAGINEKELGYRYMPLIERGNLKLYFNKKLVRSVLPFGASKSGSIEKNFNGSKVVINYANILMGDDSKNSDYFRCSLEGQGVYLYVNGCFVKHFFTKDVIYKNPDGRKYKLGIHPIMNACTSIVNIHTPSDHSADIPFNSAKNDIMWEKPLGEDYRGAIDDCAGNFFREAKARGTERFVRERVLSGENIGNIDAIRFEEVRLGKDLRADAVYVEKTLPNGKPDLSSVVQIVEYKNCFKKVTEKHVYQLLAYGNYIRRKYGINVKRMMLVGEKITDDAMDCIKFLNNEGHNIRFEQVSFNLG